MPRTGTFVTSDSMLNQLYHNIVWGQKGNFVGVPTDCPQRDERLGWTGDAQVFSRTAAFNFDVAGFFTNWLRDLAADQRPNGSVPDVIPDVLVPRRSRTATSSAGWGDAAVIVPWTMYLTYGDTRLLERQYPSMRAYVEYQRKTAGDKLLWNSGWHYGDWLAFATTRSDYPGATTDKDLIATAFYAHSTDLLARSAKALGKTEDARDYRALFERIREAWTKEYVTATGRLSSNTQTAYALALEFGLLPEARRPDAGTRLAADVRSIGHLTTGFLGTPYLTDALTQTGHLAEAYRLLLNKRYPSWLYPITQGATTIWERWDGQKPDKSFQDVGMNSFNHYAYGAIGDWMVRSVAGLDLDETMPGYRHLIVAPQPGGGLTSARAELLTPYGSALSGWTIAGGRMRVTVRVPPNARATVHLPSARLASVTEGGRAVVGAAGVTSATQTGDTVTVSIGSGEYVFDYPAPAHDAARRRRVVRAMTVTMFSPRGRAVARICSRRRCCSPPRRLDAQERPADPAREARLAWFRDAKYGLFIHWGLYAIPAGEWKGKTIPGHRRVDHEPRADPGEGVRAAREAVQPREVRRRRVGEAREGRRHEVHRHHLQASRRLRAVRLEGEHLRRRRRDPVQARRARGAGEGVREAGDAARLLLLAVAGLARAERGGEQLGLRPRLAQAVRRVSAREGRAAGARAAHALRARRADLVRYAAHHGRRARHALHASSCARCSRRRSSTAGSARRATT